LGRGHAHAALGRPAEARREYALAVADSRAAGDWFMVEHGHWYELHLVALPYQADDLGARARLAADGARAWARATGTATTATHGAQSALPLALLEGRWEEAGALAVAGRASAVVPVFQGALVALGTLARHRGAPARAWELVRALHPAGPATAPGDGYFPHDLAGLALAADLALDAGDPALAGSWIAAHGRWLAWSGAILWRAEHEVLRARHARLAGDPARARSHGEAALTHAEEPRQPLALLAAHRLLGELATADRCDDDAARHLDAALALAGACAAPYERALTLLALAELHAATSDREAARSALDEVRAICEPLEARPALARAEALAARLAAPAAPPPAYPAGLTAREVEVLRLVAAGLPDAQVAARLFLSPYTVKAHLRAIYGKLGVDNRTAAARFAVEHGLA
ncbi:MAG TPA: response regulator transcription factor, partial [Thermomicrobiales bacterium]|nr:response regulator transcription factor [Thermomicrobiales bacterium]